MNEHEAALKRRTKQFALDVIDFSRSLPSTEPTSTICRQMVRAATGTGANYRATCRSRSKTEFIARIGVALEEADESAFWLEILAEGSLSKDPRVHKLLGEANELSAIFAASKITAAENLRRSGHR